MAKDEHVNQSICQPYFAYVMCQSISLTLQEFSDLDTHAAIINSSLVVFFSFNIISETIERSNRDTNVYKGKR